MIAAYFSKHLETPEAHQIRAFVHWDATDSRYLHGHDYFMNSVLRSLRDIYGSLCPAVVEMAKAKGFVVP